MDKLSKTQILKFIIFSNGNKLVPSFKYNTRISKQQMIKQILRYWKVKNIREGLILVPKIRVPRFQFSQVVQLWDFEMQDFVMDWSYLPQKRRYQEI